MIIDTESPEGKALVALARVGEGYLKTLKYPPMALIVRDDKLNLHTEWIRVEDAKLPERLWRSL